MKRPFVLIAAVAILTMTACGESSIPRPEGSGACALVVLHGGRAYVDVPVEIAPEAGAPAGVATLPPCNDTNDAGEHEEVFEVAELPGVSPRAALVWPGRHDMVLVHEGFKRLPPKVTRLMEAAACDRAQAPIRLNGQWLGILEADGETETDLIPPYDLELLVSKASSLRYERAKLFVRVPRSLGEPLSHEDIRSSLWEGGTLEIVATCSGAAFVAEAVTAFPP